MRPLGMTSTGYDISARRPSAARSDIAREDGGWRLEPDMAHGAFGAMGGVQTSAGDYARWVAFLLSAWPPRDDPETAPARRSSVRELSQGLDFPQLGDRPSASGGEPCAQAEAYGMGLRVAQDCASD